MESAARSATSHERLLSRVILLSAIHLGDASFLCCFKLFNEIKDDTGFSEEVEQTSVPVVRCFSLCLDSVFAFDRLMLFDQEHSDPVALTEILLETCSSITHSLGKWTFPGLWSMINFLLIHSFCGGWLVEEVQDKHKPSEITFCPSLHCATVILILQ